MQDRPAELFRARRDVECVQTLPIGGPFLRLGNDVQACWSHGSITGVPVMPISGAMSQHSPVSDAGTVVTPGAEEAPLPER